MTKQAELIKEINKLPSKYIGKVLDYVEYLRQKTQEENADDIDAYKAMAADTEREREAEEWCNAYFEQSIEDNAEKFVPLSDAERTEVETIINAANKHEFI